jgi:hypothetical protein
MIPSFINDSDHERLRRDSIFNIGRMPGGSSLHSFTGNKQPIEEEEKMPGDLKVLQKKEEKEAKTMIKASQPPQVLDE